MQILNKIKELLIKNARLIVLFIAIIALLFLIEDVLDNDIISFDENGYRLVSEHLISDTMNPIAIIITNFANVYWLIGLSILICFAIKNKKIGISIMINLGLSALVNFILKQILQRPRPVGHRIIDESGYSLPSGHSMVSMAFYGFLIFLILRSRIKKERKILLISILSILILFIGISRIYLGVHYASDVLAGFSLSISYLLIISNIYDKNRTIL
jgi:undecaprenyl-diphosphatase